MQNFKDHWLEWNQPQMFSLFVLVLIILILSLTVYIKLQKDFKVDKAPKGIVLVAEDYVNIIDNMFQETTGGQLAKSKAYIFSLATFLLLGNLLGLLGLEPIATSYSVTLALAFVSWLGVFVVGFIYQKIKYLKKYLNPLDTIGSVVPLLSLSFRIFGNITGGGSVMLLIYLSCGELWKLLPGQSNFEWLFFAPIFTPFLHMYFDIFGALIQSLIFSVLTLVYWFKEIPTEDDKEKGKENKNKIKHSQKVNVIKTKSNIY